ncbi:hypothetical protein ODZ84_03200 [Chryseobacterium fluminis]|uniref:hypothetical protein n=1 Tax=Chryseobacterium fluminis TaxID=2983606 RepID=UPI00224F9636|nr:hypothetical protein [Chryseobacterium sp. MMS21-Ot14]UZT98594.1 hypothetical protein ODZ84_03200 [Chryseobacterium sp. MMS21-Ot14]
MKSTMLKTVLLLNILFIFNCKAQTTTDYINLYNNLVPKLNSIVPNKTQFYGQNFSSFYNEIQSKNISIVGWMHDTKISPSSKYYVLKLFFCDMNLINIATDNSYQYPRVIITFENEIPGQVQNLMVQHHSTWNTNVAQFFSNMKIENIQFVGVNGYNSSDRTVK